MLLYGDDENSTMGKQAQPSSSVGKDSVVQKGILDIQTTATNGFYIAKYALERSGVLDVIKDT
jgi:hypothetical protein